MSYSDRIYLGRQTMHLMGCHISDEITESTSLVMGVLSIYPRVYQAFDLGCMLNVFRRFVTLVVIVPCKSILSHAHLKRSCQTGDRLSGLCHSVCK